MTRLESSDLVMLGEGLEDYDRTLEVKTGWTLRQIACRAAGIEEQRFRDAIPGIRVGAISTTVGRGILTGFAEAVRDVIQHLGCEAFVAGSVDVGGLAAAIEQGAQVVFLADDSRFVAIHLPKPLVVDNAEATGRGYVAALDGLAKGLHNRPVLVIGAGRVGRGAAHALMKGKAAIGVFDQEASRSRQLAREVQGVVEEDLERALQEYTILIDATPARGIVGAEHIKPETLVAAPGIPLGLTPAARSRIGDRLIHDPLQIGVATMMATVVLRGACRGTA